MATLHQITCGALTPLVGSEKRDLKFMEFYSFLLACTSDGTTNFAHAYPCFATSVAVLAKGKPVAACVVDWNKFINVLWIFLL